MTTAIALGLLGVAAGALSTLAGQGGGLLLVLACSALVGPRAALALTAPALLLGNVHRAALFRRSLDRGVALRLVAGAVPGALLGGLAAGVAPAWVLEVVLVALAALAVARAVGRLRLEVPRAALGPAGFVVGAMTGTAGGAGVLVAPILLASGLSGTAFVATTSTVAVAMHVARVLAYGANGMLVPSLAASTAELAAAILVGNALARPLRARLSARASTGIEHGALVVSVALSLGELALAR